MLRFSGVGYSWPAWGILSIFLSIVGGAFDVAADPSTRSVFKVGAIVPLSGPLADYGETVRNGFELAKQDNPEFFKTVDFVYEDSKYDGKTSLSAFNALFARGDIDLYYIWGVTPNETLLPILSARDLPVISETSLKAAPVGKPLVVRAAPTGDMTARVLSEEIRRREYRSVGVLMVDIPYYRDITDALERYLAAFGARIKVIDTVPVDMNDFKTTISKVRSKNYDAIGVFLLNDQVVTYYHQSRALKDLTPTFGASIHDSQALLSRAGPGAEGVVFVGYDVVPHFRERWLELYKDDSRVGCGANAYDTAVMIGEQFHQQGSAKLSGAEVIGRFSSIRNRKGVSGDFSFAETPEAGKHFDLPLSARIFRNGRIERP
jgi:ABC-type branched-subunit amino acid transport system substrate-binding protein